MAKEKVNRRLAAIFAADMVGYSRLMEADEEGTIARQKAHLKELIDPKIADHDGRTVKTTGDGMLVEFASVVDAVKCAVEVQQAMADREADVPEGRRIRYRVGINLGDIVIDGDDVFGDGVNVAARLEALAEPGEVLISGAAFDQVKKKLEYGYRLQGERKVKNIAEPVRTYTVLPDAEAGTVVGQRRWMPKNWVRPAVGGLTGIKSASAWSFHSLPVEPYGQPDWLNGPGSPRQSEDAAMYAHILIATDGSELSNKALVEGASLAKSLNAEMTIVTAVYTREPLVVEGTLTGLDLNERRRVALGVAAQRLASAKQIAQAAGVACKTVDAVDKRPYEAILDTANSNGCDLIVMASHGRRGITAFLLGSETQKVLTHSKLPVLVHK